MKTIEFKTKNNIVVNFGKIKPFKNICKVTGIEENVNIEVSYSPNEKLIDIADFRQYFNQTFNLLIEEIAQMVFDEIKKSASPRHLSVRVFLEGNENLTDWNVLIEE